MCMADIGKYAIVICVHILFTIALLINMRIHGEESSLDYRNIIEWRK